MIQIFGVMLAIGAFLFLGFGFAVANSIEAKESEIASNVMMGVSICGLLSFLVGIIGLIVVS